MIAERCAQLETQSARSASSKPVFGPARAVNDYHLFANPRLLKVQCLVRYARRQLAIIGPRTQCNGTCTRWNRPTRSEPAGSIERACMIRFSSRRSCSKIGQTIIIVQSSTSRSRSTVSLSTGKSKGSVANAVNGYVWLLHRHVSLIVSFVGRTSDGVSIDPAANIGRRSGVFPRISEVGMLPIHLAGVGIERHCLFLKS